MLREESGRLVSRTGSWRSDSAGAEYEVLDEPAGGALGVRGGLAAGRDGAAVCGRKLAVDLGGEAGGGVEGAAGGRDDVAEEEEDPAGLTPAALGRTEPPPLATARAAALSAALTAGRDELPCPVLLLPAGREALPPVAGRADGAAAGRDGDSAGRDGDSTGREDAAAGREAGASGRDGMVAGRDAAAAGREGGGATGRVAPDDGDPEPPDPAEEPDGVDVEEPDGAELDDGFEVAGAGLADAEGLAGRPEAAAGRTRLVTSSLVVVTFGSLVVTSEASAVIGFVPPPGIFEDVLSGR